MPTPAYELTCTKNALIAKDVYDVRFTKPDGFSYEAGQFVLFDVPLLDNPNDIQTRAYSIASAPHEDELIFVIKLIGEGRASRWVAESLSEEDTVRMQGPFGRFLLDTSAKKDFLFICTSTGVAPFRSQILSALQSGNAQQIDLVFGNRHEEDLFWVDEFEALMQQHSNVELHTVLSKPNDAWEGHKGHVQDIVPLVAGDLSEKLVYVCGNPATADEVKQLCLNEWSIAKEDLHVEGFI